MVAAWGGAKTRTPSPVWTTGIHLNDEDEEEDMNADLRVRLEATPVQEACRTTARQSRDDLVPGITKDLAERMSEGTAGVPSGRGSEPRP